MNLNANVTLVCFAVSLTAPGLRAQLAPLYRTEGDMAFESQFTELVPGVICGPLVASMNERFARSKIDSDLSSAVLDSGAAGTLRPLFPTFDAADARRPVTTPAPVAVSPTPAVGVFAGVSVGTISLSRTTTAASGGGR